VLEAELTNRYLPLALSLAGRYHGRAEPDDDLRQVASLGLVKALRRYDPQVGRNFVAFAAPTIIGELRRHFRDHSWRLRVPRSAQENLMAVEKAVASLSERKGRAPTLDEISAEAGLSVEDVVDALEVRESQHSVSLDVPRFSDEPEAATLGDSLGAEEPGFDQVDSQLAVESVANLTDREHRAIELRFSEGLTQYEIAERLGVSQMQVSRVLRKGLAKMLEAVQGDEAPDGRKSLENTTPDARFPKGRSRVRK
jgi:RNA polymerase sigma-B factor